MFSAFNFWCYNRKIVNWFNAPLSTIAYYLYQVWTVLAVKIKSIYGCWQEYIFLTIIRNRFIFFLNNFKFDSVSIGSEKLNTGTLDPIRKLIRELGSSLVKDHFKGRTKSFQETYGIYNSTIFWKCPWKFNRTSSKKVWCDEKISYPINKDR